MKLSDFVVSFIAEQDVRHIFLLPGGGNMHLVDSVGKETRIDFVACLHEQACAFAAEAYGEFTNHLAVALVTTGPGGTNCATGVAAAWIEGSACLFISGQAKRADMITHHAVRSMGQQEIDVVSVMKPITKYAVTIMEPNSIRYHLEKAVHIASSGRRGPVWIEVPLDVQAAEIDPEKIISYTPEVPRRNPELPSLVSRVLNLIRNSDRPIFLVGNGVRAAKAIHSLEELLDKITIPVLLTWKAIDFLDEKHPQFRGRPGGIGQRFSNFVQQSSDCIIIIGARLDMPSLAFSHKGFAPNAKKVMVDCDANEIFKMQTHIDLPICADANEFINEMLMQANKMEGYSCENWLDLTKNWQRTYPVVLPEYWNVCDYVSTYAFYDYLSDIFPDDAVIVPGSAGACSDILMQTFRVKKGQRIVNAPGLGAMGTGLPGSIGVCIAAGRKKTICINGDGGFQLNIQELETVNRLKLPIKYFILNNEGYASIVASQTRHFSGRITGANPSSGLTLPDIKKIANAYGIPNSQIMNHNKMKEMAAKIIADDGPFICEVMINPDEETVPRVTAFINERGEIESKPMEDMYPFLGNDEISQVIATAKLCKAKR